jgi:hypothetical protein
MKETVTDWLAAARDWLDERGMVAWIGAMVLGFILFWPLGLGILFYMIWSKRMNCRGWKRDRNERLAAMNARGGTGNAAFDAYREETLRRLEEERDAFLSFLTELRAAKDRAEFDQFMARRAGETPQGA